MTICFVCGGMATVLCHTENIHFCDACSKIWHTHPKRSRANHDLEITSVKIQLVSVICKENDHYVCFSRIYGDDQWLFFDSMAERKGKILLLSQAKKFGISKINKHQTP